jgi:hypothetical protein
MEFSFDFRFGERAWEMRDSVLADYNCLRQEEEGAVRKSWRAFHFGTVSREPKPD